MSSSKWLQMCMMLGISAACCAKSPHRYECPATLAEGHVEHRFDSFRVFDTPPQNKGELMPTETADGAEVPVSKNSDIYLVCGYAGTARTIVIHAPKVSLCKTTDNPGAAWCD